jgi:SAM-dependent methyltransferase
VQPITRLKNVLRSARQLWGSSKSRQKLWNREYAGGRWAHCENTAGDCVYPYIHKYCRHGSILDLGCGSGNTGNELDPGKYEYYTGVEISDVALEQARRRSELACRNDKNQYVTGDITKYVPLRKYDTILFRDSIYYISRPKIKPTLDRYSRYLNQDGVFIVRLNHRQAYAKIVSLIETYYGVVDRYSPDPSSPIVLVFR